MIDRGCEVRAVCEGKCGFVQIDLAELAARVGRDYSLIGRRCREVDTLRWWGWVTAPPGSQTPA
jgi:hypothetical protein